MAKEYLDGSITIDNPREEMAEILKTLKAILVVDWGKDVSDLIKLSAAQYNATLASRRFVEFLYFLIPFPSGQFILKGSRRRRGPETRSRS